MQPELLERALTPVQQEPIALKEWAVAVRALGTGDEILLPRKGGIAEKQFIVEHEEFYLYPTYEHQQLGQLQERYHAALERELAAPRDPAVARITLWARVIEAYPVTDEVTARALAPHTFWTPAYILERLRWRPAKPLYALLVRAYRLAPPRDLPVLDSYGGCRSWLRLSSSLGGTPLEPVLGAAEFEQRAAPIRAILRGTTTTT